MNDDRREVRYSADAELRRPRQFLREFGWALRAAREPATRILIRDLRGQYRQSALGYLWIVLPSVATTLAWIFLNNANIINAGDTETSYAIFVLVGTLLWQGLVDALNMPLRQLSKSSGLLTKVNFPTEAIYISGFGEVVLNAFVRLLLLIPIFMWYGVVPTGWTLFAPVGIMSILVFGYGIGLLLAPLGMLYQDVGRAISVLVTFWFLVTPVAYVTPSGGLGSSIQRFNPAAPLITTTRDWLTIGSNDFAGLVAVAIASIFLVFLGLIFCRVSMPHLVDRLAV